MVKFSRPADEANGAMMPTPSKAIMMRKLERMPGLLLYDLRGDGIRGRFRAPWGAARGTRND